MRDLDDLFDLLASGQGWFGVGEDEEPVDLLEHSLQCGERLAAAAPGDRDLQLAGLFHDVGHLVGGSPAGEDDHHERRGEEVLRPVLGDRVARLVGLHVEAKRYLAAADPQHPGRLSRGSTVSLRQQGGAMDDGEIRRFRADPLFEAVVALRRADEAAKEPARATGGLEHWRHLARRHPSG